MRRQNREHSTALYLTACALTAIVLLILWGCGNQESGSAGDPAGPDDDPSTVATGAGIREPGFFGINTGPGDVYHQSEMRLPGGAGMSTFVLQARVKVTRTATASAMAGVEVLDGPDAGGYVIGLYPDEHRWKIYDTRTMRFAADEYQADAFSLNEWHLLRIEVTADRIHVLIDGARVTPPTGVARRPGTGSTKLKVDSADAQFDDVVLTEGPENRVIVNEDFAGGLPDWNASTAEAWSVEDDGQGPFLRGNVMLGVERLLSPDLSPEMDMHFDQLRAAGATSIRVFARWKDIQAEGPGSDYWDYLDAMVIAAHEHGIAVAPAIVHAPNWAVAPEIRGDAAYYAYAPERIDDFTRFVKETVDRYKPGGILAIREGWDDGYGATSYEIGHEFNVGMIYYEDGSIFFAGWQAGLDRYLDLLQAGHDQVKSSCPGCLVLNSGIGDDVPVSYPTSRHDPGSSRQTVWQGAEDFYEAIQARHPGEPHASDRYFDVLNIHTYEWFMLSAGGQAPDLYRDYGFPDRQWYRDRLLAVTDVMKRYGDGGKDIWLTETSYASADFGDPYGGFVSEQQQALGLRYAYEESAAVPQVKRVYWWYLYDSNRAVGLVRKDLSTKPSYDEYARLSGAR